MGWDAIIHVPRFMKIGKGVQAIIRFCFKKFRDCDVGITVGRDLWNAPFKWTQHNIRVYTKIHDDRFRHLTNVTVISATILESVILVLLVEGIYEVYDDRFRHLSNIMCITAAVWEAVLLVLLIEGNYELRRWNGFTWHDLHTKFHEDSYRRSAILRVCARNFRGCNVRITDWRDQLITSLRWGEVPWYTYQVL
jgi:hypothetical protein